MPSAATTSGKPTMVAGYPSSSANPRLAAFASCNVMRSRAAAARNASCHPNDHSPGATNKQHGAAPAQLIRDDVGDRLAFAGAGRANQHKIALLCRRHYRSELRAVGGQRCKQIRRSVFAVDISRLRHRPQAAFKTFGRAVYQMPHQTAFAQVVGAINQIFPHQVFREGKCRKRAILQHLEPGYIPDFMPQNLQNARNIQAAFIAWQFTL